MTQWTNTTTYIQQLNTQLPLHGQVAFPATQVASADANTLDDYEEGTFTPALTFATPGNLAVAYSAQFGSYTKVGRHVSGDFTIITSSFVHTTASGSLNITGMPFAASGSPGTYTARGALTFGGITKASYTQYVTVITAGGSLLTVDASGSGVAATTVAFGDMPTGGSVVLAGSFGYRV